MLLRNIADANHRKKVDGLSVKGHTVVECHQTACPMKIGRTKGSRSILTLMNLMAMRTVRKMKTIMDGLKLYNY